MAIAAAIALAAGTVHAQPSARQREARPVEGRGPREADRIQVGPSASRPSQVGWGRGQRHGPGHPEPPPPGGAEGGGPGFGRPDPREFFLSPEERREVLEFAEQHFPEVYEHLREQQGHRPYFRMQHFIWPMIRLMRIAKYDPELAELLIAEQKVEMKLAELKRDYLEFPAESVRAKIKTQMRELLEQRFDLRRRRLEREIRSLQERLEQARQRLQQQDAAKNALIDTELDTQIQHLQDQPPVLGGGLDGYDLQISSPQPASKPSS